MPIFQLAAPNLAEVSVGGATLYLLEALEYSADSNLVLVRATFGDDADPFRFHYAVWAYDLRTQQYVATLNNLFTMGSQLASGIDILSAQIFERSGQNYFIAEISIRSSAGAAVLMQVDAAGNITDLLAPFLDIGAELTVDRYAISADGRFLAVQTESPLLAPAERPDVNDASDIYLLDLQTNLVTRVSEIGGAGSTFPVVLGDVAVRAGVVAVSMGSVGVFSNADQNSASENPADVYLWSSAFTDAGVSGPISIALQTKATSGLAAGYVDLLSPIQLTDAGTFFTSIAPDLVSGDSNSAPDVFLSAASGVSRVSLAGVTELAAGSSFLAASPDGRYVALLTSSPEVAGDSGVQQAVVVDRLTGNWRIASASAQALANEFVTGGALSVNGAQLAFTSAATNLSAVDPVAIGGSLFSATLPQESFLVTASASSVDEGAAVTFTVATTNVKAGSLLSYSLSGVGITPADVVGSQMSGVLSISADGTATFTVQLAADSQTEGAETLIASVMGQNASVVIGDASRVPGVQLSGATYHWKSHALLGGATMSAQGGAGPAEGAQAPLQLKNLTWSATGVVTAEVWAQAAAPSLNVGFELDLGAGAQAQFTQDAALTGWTVLGNAQPSGYMLGAFTADTNTALGSGSHKLGVLSFNTGTAQQAQIGLLTGEVGTVASTPYAINLARTVTDAAGSYTLTELDPGAYALQVSRGVADLGNAITSADALAALRISVGLNPNTPVNGVQPKVSPYQIMAADVAGVDGRITSADALAILRMSVKLPTAPAAEWLFVEETRDFWNEAANNGQGAFTLTRTAALWDKAIAATLQDNGEVNLVGVLKGDVNGTWAAPAGSQDLDVINPLYFQNLSSLIGAPLDQWAVV